MGGWRRGPGRTGTAKAARMRLVKAELTQMLANYCLSKQHDLDGTNASADTPTDRRVLPVHEWPADDPFRVLMDTYDLTALDLAKIYDQLGEMLEAKADRGGYSETWEHELASLDHLVEMWASGRTYSGSGRPEDDLAATLRRFREGHDVTPPVGQ